MSWEPIKQAALSCCDMSCDSRGRMVFEFDQSGLTRFAGMVADAVREQSAQRVMQQVTGDPLVIVFVPLTVRPDVFVARHCAAAVRLPGDVGDAFDALHAMQALSEKL